MQTPPDQPMWGIATLWVVREPEEQLSLGKQPPPFCLWTQDMCQADAFFFLPVFPPQDFPILAQAGFEPVSLSSSAP